MYRQRLNFVILCEPRFQFDQGLDFGQQTEVEWMDALSESKSGPPTDHVPRPNSQRGAVWCIVVALLAPFLFLFQYVVPSTSLGRQITNDFGSLYFKYKVYLLDVMSHEFRIPMWSPSEAAGFPFFSNPFAAPLYPPNLLLALVYRINGGYSLYDHQLFTVAGVSILCLGLYLWLASLGFRPRHAIVAALIMGLSFKVTEVIRFPNAVHTAAWMPWVLLGITLVQVRGRFLRGGIIIAAASFCMLTAGYPYFAYYSQFLILPYILLLLIPRTRRLLCHDRPAPDSHSQLRAFLVVAASGVLALLAVAPYLYKMRELLAQTTDRNGASFAYSTANPWHVVDTIGSLVFPPAALTEGWYYFGILPVLLTAVFAIELFFGPRRRRKSLEFFILIVVWFVLITLLTTGAASGLFRFLWNYWPGFSSLRVWPRVNILLVFVFALLIVRVYAWFERTLRALPMGTTHRNTLLMVKFTGVLALILVVQYNLLSAKSFNAYWTQIAVPGGWAVSPRCFLYAAMASGTFAAGLIFLHRKRRTRAWLPWLAAATLVLCLVDSSTLGARQWSTPAHPSVFRRRDVHIAQMMPQAFTSPRVLVRETIALRPVFFTGILPNWFFQRYVDFLAREGVKLQQDALIITPERKGPLDSLLGTRRLRFATQIDQPTMDAFLADSDPTSSPCLAMPTFYNGDELKVNVDSRTEGYLCFIDNWDPNWRATVNGKPAEVHKVLGTFKAVRIPPGKSIVHFEYRLFG